MIPSHDTHSAYGGVLSIIMGGGQGTRLYPLTMERSKPAVPLAGKYRLVDIPISNCINSALKRIYLLTQFNSASLHRHISQSFKFDHFSKGFVEILAAEQTMRTSTWYEGTADAVRKNLGHFLNNSFEYALILSGDQLYRMDFRKLIDQHKESGADITISTIPVGRRDASSLGIMDIDATSRITRFVEKPVEEEILKSLKLDPTSFERLGIQGASDHEELFLASMGIYIFNRDILLDLLDNSLTDFGKHIIPAAIDTHKVHAHVFQGYWEDIGTIRSFFEANIDMSSDLPRFNFFDMKAPIFTRPRFLPASKINGAQVEHAVISDGCIINNSRITNSIIGIRSLIGGGCDINRVVMMGSDFYESQESIAARAAKNEPPVGIGSNTRIENAIIDKNARIGSHCVITPAGKPDNLDDRNNFFIRDGIVIIPKGGVIPDNTVL